MTRVSKRFLISGIAALAVTVMALVVGCCHHTITGIPTTQKVVALTFDDGPNAQATGAILDYLREVHVHATFFVVGKAVERHPELARRELSEGHVIGNHSMHHRYLPFMLPGAVGHEIDDADEAIARATGIRTRLFRPPFGLDGPVVQGILLNRGYRIVKWSIPLVHDWQQSHSAKRIADDVLRRVTPGSIFVLHDGNQGEDDDRNHTVEATRIIVKTLLEQGYRFVTVPELLAIWQAPVAARGP
jgi:peptidoglycan/xylan/chitin deacetylase (PgdA/CDA1 family)